MGLFRRGLEMHAKYLIAAAIALAATTGLSSANALGVASPPITQNLDLNRVLGFGEAVVPFNEEGVPVALGAARTSLVPALSSTTATFQAEEPEIPRWFTKDTISLEEIARVQAENPRCLIDSSGCVPYMATNILVEPHWLAAQS